MADPLGAGGGSLWLDASDFSTITLAAGTGRVTTWADKSNSSHSATAATTARPTWGTRFLNGHPVLDFDGVANRMATSSFALAQPYTFAAVVQNDDGANSTSQHIMSDVTNFRGLSKDSTNVWILFSGSSISIGVPDAQPHIIIGLSKASPNATISLDRSEISGNAGAGSTAAGISIGGASNSTAFWNGAIAEIVAYTGELVAADRARLYNYFYNKWFARSIVPMQATLLRPNTLQLLPTERLIRPAVVATPGTITGTLATTNANDTSAAAGTTTVTGTLAKTNANDTSTAAGTTTVTGALAKTNANDTLSAAGSMGSPVSGTLATTNANDTSVAAGTTKILGTSATTNANDTLTASGVVTTPVTTTTPQQVGGTLSGRRGPYTAVDAELEAILRDDEEILCLI